MPRLQAFDATWIAVAVGSQRLRGRATYLCDPALGNCLAIAVEGSPGTEILLHEEEWQGEVHRDSGDCEFLVRLNP